MPRMLNPLVVRTTTGCSASAVIVGNPCLPNALLEFYLLHERLSNDCGWGTMGGRYLWRLAHFLEATLFVLLTAAAGTRRITSDRALVLLHLLSASLLHNWHDDIGWLPLPQRLGH